jgi:hypothetical protein
MTHQIAGTPIFDGEAAQKGYALNRMCFSNSAENRAEFLRDEDAYLPEIRSYAGAKQRRPAPQCA